MKEREIREKTESYSNGIGNQINNYKINGSKDDVFFEIKAMVSLGIKNKIFRPENEKQKIMNNIRAGVKRCVDGLEKHIKIIKVTKKETEENVLDKYKSIFLEQERKGKKEKIKINIEKDSDFTGYFSYSQMQERLILAPKQAEVFELLVDGLKIKEIALKLNKAQPIISIAKKQIIKKAGLKNGEYLFPLQLKKGKTEKYIVK